MLGQSSLRSSGGCEELIEPKGGEKEHKDHGNGEKERVAVGKKNFMHDGASAGLMREFSSVLSGYRRKMRGREELA